MNEDDDINFKSVFRPVEKPIKIKVGSNENNMTQKRINISLHPEVIKKLDRIKKKRQYNSRSRMIEILIREYNE